MAIVDIRDRVGKNRPQSSRRVEIPTLIDTAAINIASGDSALFVKTPKGFVHEGTDVLLLTAEGGTATIDIGDTTDPDGLLDGGNLNGALGLVARAGTEAYVAGKPLSEKELYVLANNALDAAKFLVILRGYINDDVV
jgi:hypothetical protein